MTILRRFVYCRCTPVLRAHYAKPTLVKFITLLVGEYLYWNRLVVAQSRRSCSFLLVHLYLITSPTKGTTDVIDNLQKDDPQIRQIPE